MEKQTVLTAVSFMLFHFQVLCQEDFKRFELNVGYGAYVDVTNVSYGYGFDAADDIGTNLSCAISYRFNKKWGIEGGYMRFTDPRRERKYYEVIPNQVVIDLDFRQYSYSHFPYISFDRHFLKKSSDFKVGLGINLEHHIYQQYNIINDIRFFPVEVPRVIVSDNNRDPRNIELGVLLNIDYKWSPNPYYHFGVKLLTSYLVSVDVYNTLTIVPYFGIKF